VRRSRGRSDDARAEGAGKSRAPVALRRPRRALAVALLLIVGLSAFGIELEDRLSPASLNIAGTPVSHANALLREHFGETAPFVVLLEGPPAQLDQQGPALIRTLREDPKVTTLSPWDRGSVKTLRPTPRRALILLDFHVASGPAVKDKVPLLNEILEEKIHPPVRATQTGGATITRAIQDGSISASEEGELIAFPVLLIVLLLVFRSPVAAAIPLGFGAVSVLTSRGLLSILTHWFGVEALALTVCSMMGLALGVDYALLLVSRFREELAAGADPTDAAWTTRRTAGRTTAFAGSTLILSMVVALFVVPGSLLASLAGTLALVVLLTVLVATLVGPPLLVLIGHNIDRWRIGGPVREDGSSGLMRFVSAALRRPAAVAALIGGVVLVLAAPALALKTGPFSPEELAHDDPARVDAERIGDTVGEGFEAPYVIIAATDHGPITNHKRLAALTHWQRRLAANPSVRTVIGPEQVSKPVEPLQKNLSGVLASNDRVGPIASVDRLGNSLGQAADGIADLRAGISQATNGAGLISEGSGNAEEGAITIARGLGQAASGGERAVGALDRFAEGAHRLARAQRQAVNGAFALKLNLPSISTNLRRNALRRSHKLQQSLFNEANVKLPQLQAAAQATEEQLKAALQQLQGMTVGQSDPNYPAAVAAVRQAEAALTGTDPSSGAQYSSEYAGLPTELSALQARLLADAEQAQEVSRWISSETAHIDQAAKVSKRLLEGLREIAAGGNKLAHGADRINQQAKRLAVGLGRLSDGAGQLAGGLTRLTGATSQLEHGLGEIYGRSYPLQSGVRRASVRVLSQGEGLNRQVSNLRSTSPGIFNSGFFVLSALDGTRGEVHERASEAVSLEGGGQAATLLVTPRYSFNSKGSIDLNKQLERSAAALGKEANLTTGVAGGTATLNTYSRVTKEKMPIVIAAITLATFLVLVLVLRALPLAAIAVGLNLATVGVAFGILTLLTDVPESWPLGGHRYIDAVGATMIFGVVFGLSIDYAVFLLVRMREHFDEHGDNAAAINFGLEKTARVITGAAAIMMAVFIAFAGAPIATVSQLGVGLTVAVLLDATVVRIVLLPALMLLIGKRVWWLPRPIDRVLPRLNV
jgi:putative drug exporter of the RND superfamily